MKKHKSHYVDTNYEFIGGSGHEGRKRSMTGATGKQDHSGGYGEGYIKCEVGVESCED